MLKGEAKTAYQREYMRRRRAGLKTEPKPAASDEREKLASAYAEIERLTKALDAATRQQPSQAAPPPAEARAEIERLQAELRNERDQVAKLAVEIAKLKMKIFKPPPDSESEATKALKKKIKASAVRAKVAKALTETTTTPANRLDALQAWNGLGLNKIGK
jgi:hypothetical protein